MNAGGPSASEAVPGEAWRALAGRRVYFGHQSVGYNILEGVASLAQELGAGGLALRDDADPAALEAPGLVHSKIGSNGDAFSKIQAFSNLMHAGAGRLADAALFKLCYVDIELHADPRAIFDRYTSTMDALARAFPLVRLLHCTSPLTAIPGGLKNAVKKAIGRTIWGYEQNRRRGEFNARMRERYAGAGTLFDIARLECTRPDGSVEGFDWQGARHEALFPGYSNDGGHLGPSGQRLLGRAFLDFLAGALA